MNAANPHGDRKDFPEHFLHLATYESLMSARRAAVGLPQAGRGPSRISNATVIVLMLAITLVSFFDLYLFLTPLSR